jgi:uncharacterized protein (TIRG00374 family)
MRLLRPLAILAGGLIFAWLVWEIGVTALVDQLRALSWRLPLVLLPQAVTNVFKTAGWAAVFPGARPRFSVLFPVRLAGEAVNETTPTATMGGDALKAFLLLRTGAGVPVEEGLLSVVVAKTTLVAGLGAFITGVFLLAWALADSPPALLVMLGLLAAYMALSTAGFVWAQVRGIFRLGGRALEWIGLGERVAAVAGRLDADLRHFYRDRRGRVAASLGYSFVGWATGALETWLMLALLGSPVGLMTALVIEAGAAGVRAVGFLIPGSIGVLEGGIVGLFSLLRMDPATGLAFGIVRRIREAAWILAGYACLALLRGTRAAGAVRSRPDP